MASDWANFGSRPASRPARRRSAGRARAGAARGDPVRAAGAGQPAAVHPDAGRRAGRRPGHGGGRVRPARRRGLPDRPDRVGHHGGRAARRRRRSPRRPTLGGATAVRPAARQPRRVRLPDRGLAAGHPPGAGRRRRPPPTTTATRAADRALRAALAEYLGRARGVLAHPDRIVVTSGYVQALSLLAGMHRVGRDGGPGPRVPPRRGAAGRRPGGAAAGRRARRPHRPAGVHWWTRSVLTPAHQYPTGVRCRPRAARGGGWARATGWSIEDDYDGEFRYDRQPVGAVQGMAPEQVAYVGTAAKTLGPALRLGWVVLPERLVEPVVEAKRHTDLHTEVDRPAHPGRADHQPRVRPARARRPRALPGPPRPAAGPAARRRRCAASRPGCTRWCRCRPAGPGRPTCWPRPPGAGWRWAPWAATGTRPGDHPQGLIVGYGTPSESRYPAALDVLARLLTSVA